MKQNELIYNNNEAKQNQGIRNKRHQLREGLRRPSTPPVFEERISLPPARETVRMEGGTMIKSSGKQVAYCAR